MTTPINDRHAWTLERLEEYVAGGLSADERTALEQHARECAPCGTALTDLKEMDQTMQNLFAPARPAADLEDRIIRRLWQATWRARLSSPMVKRVRFAIAASLVLGCSGLFATYAVQNNVLSNPLTGQLADSGHDLMPGWLKVGPGEEQQVGVPILSKIPGLNRLFTNRAELEDRRAAGANLSGLTKAMEMYSADFQAQPSDSVNTLMNKAHEAYTAQNYPAARQALDNILAKDPNNQAAKLFGEITRDRINYRNSEQADKTRSEETVQQSAMDKEEMIPYSQLLIYPEDWPELSRRRQGETTAGEDPRAALGANSSRLANALQGSLPYGSYDNGSYNNDGDGPGPSGPPNPAMGFKMAAPFQTANTETVKTAYAPPVAARATNGVDGRNWGIYATYGASDPSAPSADLARATNELQTKLGDARDAISRLKEPVSPMGAANLSKEYFKPADTSGQAALGPKITVYTGAGKYDKDKRGEGQNVAFADAHVDSINPNSNDSTGSDSIWHTSPTVPDAVQDKLKSAVVEGYGATGLTKGGSGNVALNGANTYSGGTTITSGALKLGSSGTTISGGTVSIANNSSGLAVPQSTGTPGSLAGLFGGNNQTVNGTGAATVGGPVDTNGGTESNGSDGTTLMLHGTAALGLGATGATSTGQPQIQKTVTGDTTTITATSGATVAASGLDPSSTHTDSIRPVVQATPDAPQPGDANGPTPPTAQASAPSAVPLPTAAQTAISNQKVIRSGTMEFEVRSFDDASDTINKVVTEEGGFIAGTNSEKLPNGKVKGTITLRVAPEHLDRVVLKLRGLGDLKTQEITAADITKEYTDLESELRANRSMEERMLDIIKNGKGTVKELVDAEKQLGTYREKIEKIEGEKRYYDNLVALSTLSITIYEKDIQQAATAAEFESVIMSVETEDVEGMFAAAKDAVDKAGGGRVVKAELRRFEASQLAAQLICEVPAEKADMLVVQFKQLGRVAGLDRLRNQSTEGGTAPPASTAKVEQKPTQISLALYNLANIAPRQTAVLTIAVPNVEEAYNKVLARVRQQVGPAQPGNAPQPAVGVVVTSNLGGQNADQMTADVRADVRSTEAAAVLADLRGMGEVMNSTITENPDTANVTTSKEGVALRLVAAAAVPAREAQTIQVAAADVVAAYQKLADVVRPLAGEKGGRIIQSQLNQQDPQTITGTLQVEIRRTDQAAFESALATSGDIVGRNISRSTDTANTLDTKVAYGITLTGANALPARENTVANIEVEDVDRALLDIRDAVATAHGHELDAGTAKDAAGHVSGRILFEVPLADSPTLQMKLQSVGKERTNEVTRNPQAGNGTLARARYEIGLANTEGLVPPDKGLGSTMRAAVSASLAALLWSLYLIINGLLVVGPWILAVWLLWKIVRRKKAPAPVKV